MELKDYTFYSSGKDMNFALFSDGICRVHYLKNVSLPIGDVRVDVYSVEPDAESKWVVIKQIEDGKEELKWFVRQHETFLEKNREKLPRELKKAVIQKFPQLAQNFPLVA
jgi:hypothetical protein